MTSESALPHAYENGQQVARTDYRVNGNQPVEPNYSFLDKCDPDFRAGYLAEMVELSNQENSP